MSEDHVPSPFLPADAAERANAVTEFVYGHMVTQDRLDSGRERRLSDWISLLTASVGQAASLVSVDADDSDAQRGAVAWFACACADTLRARADFLYGDPSSHQDDAIQSLYEALLGSLLTDIPWSPVLHVAFVVECVGDLVAAATPIICAEPGVRGPTPRFNQAVLEALRADDPGDVRVPEAQDAASEPVDDREETSWALERVARSAASAAVLLHIGGPVGMPHASP